MATELSETVNDNLYKNAIKFLHDLSNRVPKTLSVLKSFYATKFRILEGRGNVSLSVNKNKSEARCPKCCLKLTDGPATSRLKPETKSTKFGRKVLSKANQNHPLTRYQAKYLKKVNRGGHNYLVTTCKYCQNESELPLKKPSRVTSDPVKKDGGKKNRRKKKKDKFCGLNVDAVLSAAKQKVQTDRGNNKALNNNSGEKVAQKKVETGLDNNKVLNNQKAKQKVAVKKVKTDLGNSKVLNNQITNRKKKQIKNKNINKLNKMLKGVSDLKQKSSNLSHFLESFK